MTSSDFSTNEDLADLINKYFNYIDGEPAGEGDSATLNEKARDAKKNWKREPEPATITGMALFLGFNSIAEFELYERQSNFGDTLKRGRLRIEAYYEKKLHQQSATGAIFALKSMGWKEKSEIKTENAMPLTLKIEVLNTGIIPVSNEKDVIL